MNNYSRLAGLAIVGVILGCADTALAQAPAPRDQGPGPAPAGTSSHQSDAGINDSENTKNVRAWSLKGGPGAPHNILAGPEDARALFESSFLRMPKLSAEYVMGAGDQLNVTFVGGVLKEAATSLTIGNSGTITMPYIGSVQAAGLTAGELEDDIARRYAEMQFLKDPQVLVHITQYQANPIFVIGQVDNTGEYMMSQQLTVMEAILMAGGLDPGAGSFAYLHRQTRAANRQLRKPPSLALANPTVGGEGVDVIPIDLRPLKFGAVPEPDILLQKGDILVVPPSPDRRFYVVGDVSSPGAVVIPPPAERTMLVSQAIARSGGPTRTAKMSEGMLIRFTEAGRWEERKVDYLAILKGKQPDFQIQPNDIIFIPGSNAKMIGYEMLGIAPAAMTQPLVEGVKK